MKAFVIKNKEGKYLAVSSSDYEHYWTTIDFAHYFRFINGTHDAKQEAEEFRDRRYPDCKVVEITIAEGDLEKKNKVLRKALELTCKNLLVVDERTQYAFGEDYIGVMDYYIEQAKGEEV